MFLRIFEYYFEEEIDEVSINKMSCHFNVFLNSQNSKFQKDTSSGKIFLEPRFREIFKTAKKYMVEKLESGYSWKSKVGEVILYFSSNIH